MARVNRYGAARRCLPALPTRAAFRRCLPVSTTGRFLTRATFLATRRAYPEMSSAIIIELETWIRQAGGSPAGMRRTQDQSRHQAREHSRRATAGEYRAASASEAMEIVAPGWATWPLPTRPR